MFTGAGRFRGGLGLRREYLNLEDARFSIRSMKHIIQPEGVSGGQPGRTGDIRINPETPGEKRLPSRYADYPLKMGDVFRLDTPGGGGYADALEREPGQVLDDVREGLVSPEAAEKQYGVVLRKNGAGWTIDDAATQTRRAALKAEKPHDRTQPNRTRPGPHAS